MKNRQISRNCKIDPVRFGAKPYIFFLLILLSISLHGQTPEKSKIDTVNVFDRSAITGRISADGRPAVGISVQVRNKSGQSFSTFTDDNGEFRVDSLPRAAYQVTWGHAGYVAEEGSYNADGSPKYYLAGDRLLVNMVKGAVITGRVMDAQRQPVIGVTVSCSRIRNAEGKRIMARGYGNKITDDRGIYRIYGLQSGAYIVSAGPNRNEQYPRPFVNDAPTYYPSETIDTAKEVELTIGNEATGIDIRYRGELGHVVSGKVFGTAESNNRYVSISLVNSKTGLIIYGGARRSKNNETGFSVQSIADGDYDIYAQSAIGDDQAISELQHITVKGSDVTGVMLQVNKLGAIAGTFRFEPTPPDTKEQCKDDKKNILAETALHALIQDQDLDNDPILFALARGNAVPASDDGSFEIKGLVAGKYRLNVELPNDKWFVKNMSTTRSKSEESKTANLRKNIVTLNSGQRAAGITIGLSYGGAVISGRLVSASSARTVQNGLRVFLVPTDSQFIQDVFQYFDAPVQDDGSVILKNLRPGKYYVIVRPDTQGKTRTIYTTMDDKTRTKLFSEAQALDSTVDIQPCQQLSNLTITYPQKPVR